MVLSVFKNVFEVNIEGPVDYKPDINSVGEKL